MKADCADQSSPQQAPMGSQRKIRYREGGLNVQQECRPDWVGGCGRLLAQYNSDRGGRHCPSETDAAGAFRSSAVLLARGSHRPIGHPDGGWVCVLLDRPRQAKRARPSGSCRNRCWRVFSISFVAQRAALVWDCLTGGLLPLSLAGMEPEVSPGGGSRQLQTLKAFRAGKKLATLRHPAGEEEQSVDWAAGLCPGYSFLLCAQRRAGRRRFRRLLRN